MSLLLAMIRLPHPHIKSLRYRPFSVIAFLVFFLSIFDAVVSFYTPIQMKSLGISNKDIGLIIGVSSLAGAFFDIIISRMSKISYRFLYMFVFVPCILMVALLWKANTVWYFFMAMVVWGLYYDILNFANFNFVNHNARSSSFSLYFGIIQSFRTLGYLVAPLLVSTVIFNGVKADPFVLMILSLVFAFIFAVIVLFRSKKGEYTRQVVAKTSFKKIFHVWRKLNHVSLPGLLLTLFFYLYNSFFWTNGPLLSTELKSLGLFEGLTMTLYLLPFLYGGIFTERFVRKMGDENTSYLFLALGMITLALLAFTDNHIAILSIIFISSTFASVALPAINSDFSKFAVKHPFIEKEIEGIQDIFTNLGFTLGPILAGYSAELFGYTKAFSLLGLIGVIFITLLFFINTQYKDLS